MLSSYRKDTLVGLEGLVSDGSDGSEGPGFSYGFCVSCESEADGLGWSRGCCGSSWAVGHGGSGESLWVWRF